MTPTPITNFIGDVAKEMNIPEEDVRVLVDFYYKKLRKNLTDINHVSVEWPGIGTMNFQYYQTEEYLAKLKRKYERASSIPDYPFTVAYMYELKNKINRITSARELGQKHTAKRFNTFYENKKTYFKKLNDEKDLNTDL